MKKQLLYHPWQEQALKSQSRFVLMLTGIQGGKTLCGSIWSAKKFGEDPFYNSAIIAPTYKILEQSTLPTFFQQFPEYKKYHKLKESIIELPNPKLGKIFIRSADKPITLEGMTCKNIWVDEIGQIARYAWTILQGRVGFLQGQIFGTTRPYGINWLKKEFYDFWKAGDEDYEVVNFESKDNPAFPLKEYERAKRTLDPRLFAMMYQGKFERMTGLVYQQFRDDLHIVEKIPYKEFIKVLAGIDWGFVNPACLIFVGMTRDKRFYVFHEFYKAGLTLNSFIEIIKEFRKRFGVETFFADPSEPMNIQQVREAAIPVMEADNAVLPGINKVREALGNKKLFISSACKNLIDEFQTYSYESSRDESIGKEEPKKVNDHGLDDLRYILKTEEQSEVKVFSVVGEREEEKKERYYLEDFVGKPKIPNWLEL